MSLIPAIIADKDSFCRHLANLAEEHRGAALSARTVRARNRELGTAEGLEIALRAVEAWSLPGGAQPDDE